MKIGLCILMLLGAIRLVFSQDTCERKDYKVQSDVYLYGTLIDCHSDEVVVFISGSGPTDRNGNSPMTTNNSIVSLADSLAKNNISSFRYDKRTSGESVKKLDLIQGILFDDFVKDAKAVVEFIDSLQLSKKISIAGHSQGSLIAFLTAKNNPKVQSVISLAGPSMPIDSVLIQQINANSPILTPDVKNILDSIRLGHFQTPKNPFLTSLFSIENQPFFGNWMQYQPLQEISQLSIPILIVNGTEDLQVPPINASKLHKAAKSSELLIVEHMNHVLKIVDNQQDNIRSYSNATFPLSTELVKAMVSFLAK